MIQIKDNYVIREEKNGITILNSSIHVYKFFKNSLFNDFINMSISEVKEFFQNKPGGKDIIFEFPFKVSWLIENKCNLACVYCIAKNKMYNNTDLFSLVDTAKHIVSLKVMNVCISGGEPFLNPCLSEVISILTDKCAITIDTNGTIAITEDMLKIIKKANALVRISIDSLDPNVINKVRPNKYNNMLDYIGIIINNIRMLIDSNVNLMIHTVITKVNKNCLLNLSEKLIELGISRWHLFEVINAGSCKAIYNDIKVKPDELIKIREMMKKEIGERLNITFDINKMKSNSKVVLLINNQGFFFLDTFSDGIKYIGLNPKNPSNKEIMEYIDIQSHCDEYLLV